MIGAAVTAICCYTPVLAVMLGVIGFGAFIGYLDYVLLPALAVFGGITVYGLIRKMGGARQN